MLYRRMRWSHALWGHLILQLLFHLKDHVILQHSGASTMQALVGGGLNVTRLGISPGRVGGGTETKKGVAGGGTMAKNDRGAHYEGGFLSLSDACRPCFITVGYIRTYYGVLPNFL